MSEQTPNPENQSFGSMNRRRLLQTAAAAGVGVAVWTVPSVTSLGGTPAYAATCTTGFVQYEGGITNTGCICDDTTGAGRPKVASYHSLQQTTNSRCLGANFPGTIIVKSSSCAGTEAVATGNGLCPPGYGAENAGVCVTPDATHQNLYCRLLVYTTDNGGACGTNPTSIGPVEFVGTGKWFELPGVPCQGNGNIFLGVALRCSVEAECL